MMMYILFFFLMIRRPPRSTPLSLHDALPISDTSDTWQEDCIDAPSACLFCSAPPLTVSPVLHQQGPGRGSVELGRISLRSEEHTSELQSRQYIVCRLLLEKKKKTSPSDIAVK